MDVSFIKYMTIYRYINSVAVVIFFLSKNCFLYFLQESAFWRQRSVCGVSWKKARASLYTTGMRKMSTLGNPPSGASVWLVQPSHWTWTTTTSLSFCELGLSDLSDPPQILFYKHYFRFLILCKSFKFCDSGVLFQIVFLKWLSSNLF